MEEQARRRERGRGRNRRKVKGETYFDYSLLFVVIFLFCFGVVMIYSASSYEAQMEFGNAYHYAKKQLLAVMLGGVAMTMVVLLDYRIWKRWAFILYLGGIVLVLAVLSPLGIEANGARRWIGYGPLSFQPAEYVKLASIVFFAAWICNAGKRMRKPSVIIKVLAVAGAMALAVKVFTDNLSSAIIILGIVCVMVFVATPGYRWYVAGGLAVIVGCVGMVYLLTSGIIPEESSFRFGRIMAWLDPEAYPDTKGFQTLQALYAIGSGGILGKGLGSSMQKLGFLPEAQNDMIFSIICEELGLFGAIAVILLFLLMCWRLMVISNNAPDLFGSMVVVGIMAHIAIQVILNIAVVTNSMPNTGISLPFISYGGTSVTFLMVEMGIALSVSKSIRLDNV